MIYIYATNEIVDPLDDFDEDATSESLRGQRDDIEGDINTIEDLITGLRDFLYEARKRVSEIDHELDNRDDGAEVGNAIVALPEAAS
jgi:hypothetical protein